MQASPQPVLPRRDTAAFAALWVFTLLLYARPGELFPALGAIPFAKACGGAMVLLYLVSRTRQRLSVSIWPTELQCVFVIALLGLALAPIAFSRSSAFGTLLDTYLKIVCAFIVVLNVVVTRQRLDRLLLLVVLCGTFLAIDALRSYLQGEFALHGVRIEGLVGGSLKDPNDLAMNFDVLVPIAVVLALRHHGKARLLLWLSALALAAGTVATLSRGGFLGLVVACAALVLPLGRRHFWPAMLALCLAGMVFLALGPEGYRSRLQTIVQADHGGDDSIAQRLTDLDRGWYLATHHLVFGIGMGNFGHYTADGHVAHNSYLETSSELGIIGLIAYVAIIVIPVRRLSRICGSRAAGADDTFLTAVGLRASLLAYATCAMFLSIEYTWAFYLVAACAVALSLHIAESETGNASVGTTLTPRPVAPVPVPRYGTPLSHPRRSTVRWKRP